MDHKPFDQNVAQDLQRMFCEGATPSRLIRRIVESRDDQSECYQLVQQYFFEVFGVPIVRGLGHREQLAGEGWELEFLNSDVLHEMVRHVVEWHNCGEQQSDWTYGLQATDLLELFGSALTTSPPELAERWPELSEDEKSAIARSVAGQHQYYEMVQILARLVEVLQQRVLKLENELARLEVQAPAD